MKRSKTNLMVGKRIRERREYLGFTRDQFAEAVGMSSQFLADNETGRKGMSYENLLRVCDVLCVSSDYLLFGKESGNNVRPMIDILSNMDPKYFPLAENAVKTLVQTIAYVKYEKSKEDQTTKD